MRTSKIINKVNNINHNSTHIRIHPETKLKLMDLKRLISAKQGMDVSMEEMTRRLKNASSFKTLEEELLRDAELKKRFFNG